MTTRKIIRFTALAVLVLWVVFSAGYVLGQDASRRISARDAQTMMRVIRLTGRHPYVSSLRVSSVDPRGDRPKNVRHGLVVRVNSRWARLSSWQQRRAAASLFHLWLSLSTQSNSLASAMRIEDRRGRIITPFGESTWAWESSLPTTDKLF